MALSCWRKIVCITYRNNIKPRWKPYCLNCLHSDRTENYLKKHENICKIHNYCYIEISNKDNKILEYNHAKRSMRTPFIIYADLESLLEKMSACHNSLKKSSTTKINKHTASCYSFDTMRQNISLIVIEVKIVWETFVWI